MSETSNNTDMFLNLLESEKASNLNEAKKKLKKRFAAEVPTTVFEYMEQNDVPYDVALQELDAMGVKLGELKATKDFTQGLPGVTAAAYDAIGTGSKKLKVTKDGKVIAASAPTGPLGAFAGAMDILTAGFGDFDRRGGLIGGQTTGLGYNINKGLESGMYTQSIRPEGIEKLLDRKVKLELPNVEISPLGELVDGGSSSSSGKKDGKSTILDKYQDFQQKQKDFERKNRRRDALEATIQQTIQTPIYTRLIEDAAKRRLELDKAMLGAREMMPSNIQNIMLSKQAQKDLASSAFQKEFAAIEGQQGEANKFAALGMQRPFGQPNAGGFKIG